MIAHYELDRVIGGILVRVDGEYVSVIVFLLASFMRLRHSWASL